MKVQLGVLVEGRLSSLGVRLHDIARRIDEYGHHRCALARELVVSRRVGDCRRAHPHGGDRLDLGACNRRTLTVEHTTADRDALPDAELHHGARRRERCVFGALEHLFGPVRPCRPSLPSSGCSAHRRRSGACAKSSINLPGAATNSASPEASVVACTKLVRSAFPGSPRIDMRVIAASSTASPDSASSRRMTASMPPRSVKVSVSCHAATSKKVVGRSAAATMRLTSRRVGGDSISK